MRRVGLILTLVLSQPPALAEGGSDLCADSLHPVLATLTDWVAEDQPELGYGYCALASGAALTVGHEAGRGFVIPIRSTLLWPGNLLVVADSQYTPAHPSSLSHAEDLFLEFASKLRGALFLTPAPVYIYAVDTSFGDPWFFAARCSLALPDTSIWDRSDLKRRWWLWRDDPGVNAIWPRPAAAAPRLGRSVLYACMRHSVLAARPDSVGELRLGLAALEPALFGDRQIPGDVATLLRFAVIRQSAAEFLLAQSDLWPRDDREPLKLAAYYFQKDAEAWRSLADAAGRWPNLDAVSRQEMLLDLQTQETNAALALDQIVSQAPE